MYLMHGLPAITWLRFAAWLIIGATIYFLYGYRHSRLRGCLSGKPANKGAK
jgi:APA family basic amino acid/polyamine antiporter